MCADVRGWQHEKCVAGACINKMNFITNNFQSEFKKLIISNLVHKLYLPSPQTGSLYQGRFELGTFFFATFTF